jgi:hypothetical protein
VVPPTGDGGGLTAPGVATDAFALPGTARAAAAEKTAAATTAPAAAQRVRWETRRRPASREAALDIRVKYPAAI